jgi:hypothetical protein
LGEFGEHRGDPQCGRYVQAQVVVAASKVLQEGVARDNDVRCSVGTQAAHRS